MTTAEPPIQFRVLGPVQAVRGEQTVPLGGRRQRALLAILLVQGGQPIPVDRLADELWGGARPDGALVTLPTYVSRLRAALGGDVAIHGTDDGYALTALPEQLDLIRFERLVRQAETALARGTPVPARRHLEAALGLWRGTPFGDLAADGLLRIEAERLEELRLHALELQNDADLALGGAAALVPELEAFVERYPYRERLWQQLMLALYRTGRQSDALLAYGRARRILLEQLGIDPGPELEQLQGAILRHEIPAPATPEERHNIPAPLTSFVGRRPELAALAEHLDRARLVSVTGVGGVGKTRLALELAREAVPFHADGVRFVDLAPLRDPALVVPTVASTLEIREQPDVPLLEAIATGVRDLDLLLVLDNCEHMRDPVAELVSRLLTRAPRLRILATSRATLGVPGEVDFALQPLAVSAMTQPDGPVQPSDAVLLFLARAQAADPSLGDGPETIAAAAAICAAVDGLPLAIELAAARAKTLSLRDIGRRLADRYGFLVSRGRPTTPRHRTLREAMDWSHELLTPPERQLLARLSVFAGSVSLSAATEVCVAGDDDEALRLVGRLVDASLVSRVDGPGETRYRLLETVREYAAEQLEQRGETLAMRSRHAEYFEDVAQRVWVPIRREGGDWIGRVAADHDNFRAALAWLRSADLHGRFLRLAEAMWWFWSVHLDLAEGSAWLDSALDHAPDAEPGLRARAMLGAANLAWMAGDLDGAHRRARSAGQMFAALTTVETPEGPQPAARFEGGVWEIMGMVSLVREDHEGAAAHLVRSRDAVLRLPDDSPWKRDNLGAARTAIGQAALARGDVPFAQGEFAAARDIWSELTSPVGIALADLHLAEVEIEQGRHDRAAVTLARSLEVLRDVEHAQFSVDGLDAAAAILLARGDAVEALRCLGASTRLRERAGYRAYGWVARVRSRVLEEARQALHPTDGDAAWEDGRRASSAEAIDRALRQLGRPRRSAVSGPGR